MIGPDRADLSIAAARAILKLDFEPGDHARMHELSMKAQEGSLNAEEQAEIDAYEPRRLPAGHHALPCPAVLEAAKRSRRIQWMRP